MNTTRRQAPWRSAAPSLLILTLLAPSGVAASEEEADGWTGTAELSAVMTSGNAEAETLGLRAAFKRDWAVSSLLLEASALRAESTTTERFGVGVPDAFREVEISTSDKTAENYLARVRYDRELSERTFWYLGAAWDRNTFAGIDARYLGTAGFGHRWIASEGAHLTTTYGLSYTEQDNVIGTSESFAGLRLGYDYGRTLTPTTTFGSVLIADGNFDETSDYRADLTNWIAVTMSERLALKVSLQALYDNQPSLEALPLFDEDGEPTGETGLAPLDELDLVWTAALVVNF